MNLTETTHQSVLDLFIKQELETPDAIFLRQPYGNEWKEYSWKETWNMAHHAASAIKLAGLNQGDRVAILSQNCAEWIICDLAIMMGGYVSVPLYANVNATTLHDILIHSESKLLFIGKLLPKDWQNVSASLPESVMKVSMAGYDKENVTSWDKFTEEKQEVSVVNPAGADIITLIYTSGTTGNPKGVVHTHQNILNALNTAADIAKLNRKGNRFLSYLPLSHAAERGLIEFGAMYGGGSISFVESQDTFSANIKSVEPTHFFAVPRIWEKFQSKILEAMPQRRLSILLHIPLLSTYIKSKIRKSLGLNKAIIMLSGAAPISPDLLRWYGTLGMPIQEAYGMSENFNVIAFNPEDGIRIGTVGKIFKNQEVKIDPDTHEIIQKSAWIMQGYFKEPELTAETIQSGFLHTGDTGELSADGYLRITGRVKDIFKTSKGEYIAPGPIEITFLSLTAVDQACVMGSRYPQAFVLIVLSPIGKAMTREDVTKLLSDTLDDYNQNCMEYQKLRKVIIASEEWTIENGMLTPTLKMKRNALTSKYEVALESIYEKQEKVSWE